MSKHYMISRLEKAKIQKDWANMTYAQVYSLYSACFGLAS